jgi:hypothetical protein
VFCRSLLGISDTPLKTNNDLQNTPQKTEDRATETPLIPNNDLQM